MPKATENDKRHAAAHAVGLLNELQAVLTGWVLQFDQDEIEAELEPLYARLDKI